MMTNENTAARITEALTTGRITAEQRGDEDWQLRAAVGCDEWIFTYHGRTGTWRLGMHITYGNRSFLHGDGCDASGYVITDEDQMALLDSLAYDHAA